MKDGKVPRSIEQNHRSAGDAAHKLMVDKTRLFTTLKSVFTVPRSYVQEPQYRHAVGDYIGRKFGTSGLITIFQSFQPTQFHEIVSIYICQKKEGRNVLR